MDIEQNKKCIALCDEGIALAKELKNTLVESLLVISKIKLNIILLIEKMWGLLYSSKMYSQSEIGKLNLIFIDKKNSKNLLNLLLS